MFITFEGIDGSGKTTVIKEVEWQLMSKFPRWPIIRRKAPGLTTQGQKIRDLVLCPTHKMSPRAKVFLFWADMVHFQETWREEFIGMGYAKNFPKTAPHVVLCDRWVDSTLVYQIFASDQFDPNQKAALVEVAKRFIVKPDLTFILDIPIQVAKKRLTAVALEYGTPDPFENSDAATWERRRTCYAKLLPQKFPDRRYHIIDASRPVEQVVSKITSIIMEEGPVRYPIHPEIWEEVKILGANIPKSAL